MITLKFSTEDLSEDNKPYYDDFEIIYSKGHDYTLEKLLEIFEVFLKAKGFDNVKLIQDF